MTELDKSILAGFTGSETFTRHPLVRHVIYTEGAKYVADIAGAHWLLDIIATSQTAPELRFEEFQVWKLIIDAKSSAKIVVEDGNQNEIWHSTITWTDFPRPGFTFWYVNNVIMLPTEY